MTPQGATVECLRRLFDALDYELLGDLYCDEGGAAFWADRRGPAFELGLAWASLLSRRLPKGGRSLYMGAGVAELPALVVEVGELQRQVRVANLLAEECAELNRALKQVGIDGIEFEPRSVEELFESGPFDHFTMVSVFTDPDFFPQVSGVNYGRLPPVLVDVAAFEAERQRICQLIASVFDALQLPAWITTSAEEASWFLWEAERRGISLAASDDSVETAVIGDPVGFLRASSE